MKMKNFRHLLTWLFVAIFALGIILPVSQAAQAEGNPEIPDVSGYFPESTLVYLDTPAEFRLIYSDASVKDVTSLKSSNKKVATVKKMVNPEMPDAVIIRVTPKKAGKTKVSFKFKHDNKTYKFKMNVVVKKYENPFKSLKVGTLSLAKYLDLANHTEAINAHVPLKKALSKKKLNFTLKSGWKLQNLALNHAGTWKMIKNGQKITIKKGDEIDFQIRDSKGNDIWFYFFFD